MRDFPDGPVVENLPASAWDMGSVPGRGRPRRPGGAAKKTNCAENLASLGQCLSPLRGCPLGSSPQSGSDKTLLFLSQTVDYFCQQGREAPWTWGLNTPLPSNLPTACPDMDWKGAPGDLLLDSYTVYPFVSGWFHLDSCPLGSSMLCHGSEFPYF